MIKRTSPRLRMTKETITLYLTSPKVLLDKDSSKAINCVRDVVLFIPSLISFRILDDGRRHRRRLCQKTSNCAMNVAIAGRSGEQMSLHENVKSAILWNLNINGLIWQRISCKGGPIVSLINESRQSALTDQTLIVYNFLRSLPASIKKDDQKAVAQYLVEQIIAPDGYVFSFHRSRQLHQYKVRGMPSYLGDSTVYTFGCTQRKRHWVNSDNIPLDKRRNRRKLERLDCSGTMNVYFPRNPLLLPPLSNESADIPDLAFRYCHKPHTGRPTYGVPVIIRTWIQQNLGRTSYETWKRLMTAVENKEFPGLENTRYSQRHVSYWHSKACLF